MKNLRAFLLIPTIVLVFSSCDENDGSPLKNQFKVSDYSAIQIGGNAVVEARAGSPGDKTIVIEGNPDLVSQFQVQVVSRVLHIKATQRVRMGDRIKVIIPVSTLHSITLERDQEAEVYWDEEDATTILDHVEIKTEANSKLALSGLKIRSLAIQQEAQSEVYLNSLSQTGGELKVVKDEVRFVNDTTVVVNNETLWYFQTSSLIQEEGVEYYIFSGDRTRSFYIVNDVNAVLEATSQMLASECAVNHFDIKLEGTSTADIWVLGSLSGKGEGQSRLYYHGDPALTYTTEGGAQIIGL
jgi:hypothetical protein